MDTAPASRSRSVMVWIGRAISALPIFGLAMSAYFKFQMPADVVKEFQRIGWSEDAAFGLGIVEVVCIVLYAIPQTAVLGAILTTGYLGGAIATHARMNEGFLPPVIIGVLVWLGLFLRDARLRALLPLRSNLSGSPIPAP